MTWSLAVHNLVGGSTSVVSTVQINLFIVSRLDVLMTSAICQISVPGMGIIIVFSSILFQNHSRDGCLGNSLWLDALGILLSLW